MAISILAPGRVVLNLLTTTRYLSLVFVTVALLSLHATSFAQISDVLGSGGAGSAPALQGSTGAGVPGSVGNGGVPIGDGTGFTPGSALESAISGDEYVLGPGDLLSVSIWGPQSFTYSLPVTLEGQVLIPTMGPLNVDRLSLSDAKRLIRQRILRDFKNVDVTVSLVSLRKFQVHVLGQVTRPGTYLSSAVDRASSAIGWAGGLAPKGSQRRILIRNREGVRREADLFSFLQRGVEVDNPTLRDGDVVYVPFEAEKFSVSGAVNQEGPIEFVPGDKFSDALFFAGGLEQHAYLDTVEVVRYARNARDGTRFLVLATGEIVPAERGALGGDVSPPAVLEPFAPPGSDAVVASGVSFPDFELVSGDIIFVRQRSGPLRRDLVEVVGEVEFPGEYPIHEGQTRLSELLEWAGGVSDEVFLAESYVLRRPRTDEEDREFERLSKIPVGDMTTDEYEYFKVRSREQRGRMVVDFEDLLLRGNEAYDILLQAGDVIHLAKRRDFVTVIGLAAEPGNIPFDLSLGTRDYLARAGGYAEDADRGNTRVIRAGSGEWIRLSEVSRLDPGDTIWIPEKQERDYWATFKDILSVTAQILTVYLIVDRATDGN